MSLITQNRRDDIQQKEMLGSLKSHEHTILLYHDISNMEATQDSITGYRVFSLYQFPKEI